ncbi:hypothetical protein [Planomonospora parontospora]|uniref:hypothetical protein n=1 Tax=Planomonospora parontospora TaxID=58119 RepID=UPI00166FF7B7|nr:hypothetical protein [Planomonospora parontospora]GGL35754.1 hypothetical protein GCM10014719_41190 [Planomonospora parontospora subsp. antibiotica]GII17442.1 hypothetical protein Ppa05_41680 [Planomonospora parontospora subsp. antibiotica]
MFVLGVSWLLLAPVCLWLLLRGRAWARVTAVLALAALEAATLWLDAGIPSRAPAARPSALRPAVPEVSGPAVPEVSRPASTSSPSPRPAATASPRPMAPAPTRPGNVIAHPAVCSASPLVPEEARLITRRGALRAVALSWAAPAGGCDTATVVVRRRGGTLRVWLHGGTAVPDHPAGARTLPVSVTGGTASMQVRLVPPLPGRPGLTAVDGRTGRPIALR